MPPTPLRMVPLEQFNMAAPSIVPTSQGGKLRSGKEVIGLTGRAQLSALKAALLKKDFILRKRE